MNATLTGQQIQAFRDALTSAFPRPGDLAQLVQFALDENLDAIVGPGPLGQVAFALIRWAEARGRTGDLLAGALRENPGNPALRGFADGLGGAAGPAPEARTSAPTLPNPLLMEVHRAAIALGLGRSRAALLSGLSVGLADQLEVAAAPSEQVLSDLRALNRMGKLRDGSFPLAQWIETALQLTRLRVESEVFERARQILEH